MFNWPHSRIQSFLVVKFCFDFTECPDFTDDPHVGATDNVEALANVGKLQAVDHKLLDELDLGQESLEMSFTEACQD